MLQHAAAALRRVILASAMLAAAMARAQAAPDPKQAWDEAAKAAQSGPAEIKLLDQAVLKLPEGRVFIPQPQATRLLQAMGNPGEDSRLQGLVFPKEGTEASNEERLLGLAGVGAVAVKLFGRKKTSS